MGDNRPYSEIIADMLLRLTAEQRQRLSAMLEYFDGEYSTEDAKQIGETIVYGYPIGKCPNCKGRGEIVCPQCSGEGIVAVDVDAPE